MFLVVFLWLIFVESIWNPSKILPHNYPNLSFLVLFLSFMYLWWWDILLVFAWFSDIELLLSSESGSSIMTGNSFVVLMCPHYPFVFLGASETKYGNFLLHYMLICLNYKHRTHNSSRCAKEVILSLFRDGLFSRFWDMLHFITGLHTRKLLGQTLF